MVPLLEVLSIACEDVGDNGPEVRLDNSLCGDVGSLKSGVENWTEDEVGASESERDFFKMGGGGDRAVDGLRAGLVDGPALISDSVEEGCGLT